ncbi:hypothetical protein chiPu_0017714 [Chiloscyllium punctatum]|uniref:Uncharacterized protein n=1 Tax=Chiloscyllium punctatum TaxID=137246 RepID=A0A401RIA7_CHIPU|nr:hypothetical protein [Chiloscyllium punctatum]
MRGSGPTVDAEEEPPPPPSGRKVERERERHTHVLRDGANRNLPPPLHSTEIASPPPALNFTYAPRPQTSPILLSLHCTPFILALFPSSLYPLTVLTVLPLSAAPFCSTLSHPQNVTQGGLGGSG